MLSEQPHRCRVEIDRTLCSRTKALWATAALQQARDSRRHLLRDSWRNRLASATPRSASLADRLLLLHGLAPGRTLATHARHAARPSALAQRKKKAPTAAILDSQSVKV